MKILKKALHISILLLSFLLLFTTGNAPAGADAAIIGQSIEGTVYYSRTPVAGIQIRLLSQEPSNPLVATTVSDSAGKYALTNIPAGTYYLDVSSSTHEWVGRTYSLPDQPGQGSLPFDVHVRKNMVVLQPEADAVITTLHPVFCWQPLAEAVRYSLQVNPYPAGETVEYRDNLTAACYEMSSTLQVGSTYEWFLSAWDADGQEIGLNYAFSAQKFHINMLLFLPQITNVTFSLQYAPQTLNLTDL